MAEFADDGDLEIMQRIEVKRRKSLTFSSKEDFPYNSLIVDVCHTYDKAKIKPYAYIILNEKMDCAFIAYSKHQKHWKKTVNFIANSNPNFVILDDKRIFKYSSLNISISGVSTSFFLEYLSITFCIDWLARH